MFLVSPVDALGGVTGQTKYTELNIEFEMKHWCFLCYVSGHVVTHFDDFCYT